MITVFRLFDLIIIIIKKKTMGCGAVCGNNSSIYEPNQFSHKIILTLIPRLKHAKQFISTYEYQSFIKQIHLNPLKYRLKLTTKLIPKQQIDPGMLIKWKVILYCFQTSNPHFVNCLGHKFKKLQQQKAIQNYENDNDQEDEENLYVLEEDSVIFPHKYSSQVEKDIDRTCELPDEKKKIFERVLKRITNHFPTMGYTQGINFIVGYLLTVGYEQFDVYWMFVHFAIDRRYLMLGFFQDNLPLSSIYRTVFKNILQRVNTPLHDHLYEQLQITEYEWVFKWLFTYFTYSFPLQMIKYVFDMFIEMGGLALIKLAVSITQELADVLMKQHDGGLVATFLQSLKNIDVFNEHISINKVIERAYGLEMKRQDFNGIDTDPTNFYAQFILASLQKQRTNASQPTLLIKVKDQSQQAKSQTKQTFTDDNNDPNSASNKLLQSWYEKLTSERQDFLLTNTLASSHQAKPKKQRISIEHQLHKIIRQSQQQEIKSPQKQNSINSIKDSIKDSIEMKKQSVPSTGCSLNKKGSQVNNRDDVSEIDELWEEEDRNSSVSKKVSSQMSQQSRTQNGFNLKVRKTSYEDQLDKFASTHCNKPRAGGNAKISSIFTQQKLQSLKPKINNFQIPTKGSHLARAGQHILSNMSINDHSQHQSTNSQYSKFSQKQKTSKENDIYGKGYYRNKGKKQVSLRHNQDDGQKQKDNKVDQNSLQDRNSSGRDSYVDPHNSFYISNQSIQDHNEMKNSQIQAQSVKAFDSHRQRVSTQQDILTNSLHVSNIKENNSKYAADSNASEIQIYQAPQIFKKKNRVSTRINGAQQDIFVDPQRPSKLVHTISQADMMQKEQKSMKTIKMQQNSIYQQSYESIFVPSQGQKSSTFRFHQQQLQKCEVESVK